MYFYFKKYKNLGFLHWVWTVVLVFKLSLN